jgi:hypothetical protein
MWDLKSGDVFICYLTKAVFYIAYSWLALLLLSCSEGPRFKSCFRDLVFRTDLYGVPQSLNLATTTSDYTLLNSFFH